MHLAKEGQRKQQNKKKEKEKKRKIEGQKCSINLPLRNFPTCASSHNSLSDLPWEQDVLVVYNYKKKIQSWHDRFTINFYIVLNNCNMWNGFPKSQSIKPFSHLIIPNYCYFSVVC